MMGFKLLRQRKDGSLGPLFINRRQHIPLGVWLTAKSHPTKGYALRPGWHGTTEPRAPHLRTSGDRVWCSVEFKDFKRYARPESQGGTWILAKKMRVNEIYQQ